MALVLADRVQEITTTSGTGTITLNGAVPGFQDFLTGIGSGNSTYYTIYDPTTYEWEVGIGTFTSSGTDTLSRDTVLSNSLGTTAKINLVGNQTNVFVTYPSEKSVNLNADGVMEVGEPISYADTGLISTFASTVAGYNQVVVQNKSTATNASANLNVSNDASTSSNGFAELGINSSTFSNGPGCFNIPGAAYVASAGTDLAIGTYNAYNIHFATNSSTTDAMTIFDNGGTSLGGYGNPGIGNLAVNKIVSGITETTASGGTTALVAASTYYQRVVGTTTHTIQLPDATTLLNGTTFIVDNDSTGNVTVTNFATASLDVLPSGGLSYLYLTDNSTVAGTWTTHGYLPSIYNFNNTIADFANATIINAVWNGTTIGSGYGGTGLTTFGAANNALYSTGASTLTAGTLPVAAGGTGLTSLTANYVPYGNGTGAYQSSATFTYNGTTLTASNYSTGGNITFTGTGNRITGNFTGATLSDNVVIQTSTANQFTRVVAAPNGTGNSSTLLLENNSSLTNGEFAQILASTTAINFTSGVRGTGTFLPMTFSTGGSERMRIGATGGISVGTTDTTSYGNGLAVYNLPITGVRNFGGSGSINIIARALGTAQGQLAGYSFYPTFVGTADSGPRRAADIWSGFNAGNWGTQYLSFGVGNAANDAQDVTPERMRINSAGEVLIGGTTSLSSVLGIYGAALGTSAGNQTMLERTQVNSSNANYIEISEIRTSAGSDWTTSGSRIQRKIDSTWHGYIQFGGTGIGEGITFGTGGSTVSANSITERMRIDNAGNVSMTGTLSVNTSAVTGSDALVVNQGGDIRIFNAGNTVSANLYCDVSGVLHNDQRLVNSSYYFRLNSGVVGANVNTVQNTFGVGIALDANTQYEFEIYMLLNKTAGTTSHTLSVGFGGTAGINNISYATMGAQQAATPLVNQPAFTSMPISTAQTLVKGASTTAIVSTGYILKGTVSISTAGTFIPQYQCSAAPGGAYTTQPGSYVKVTKLGPSGANINVGGWA